MVSFPAHFLVFVFIAMLQTVLGSLILLFIIKVDLLPVPLPHRGSERARLPQLPVLLPHSWNLSKSDHCTQFRISVYVFSVYCLFLSFHQYKFVSNRTEEESKGKSKVYPVLN